jgi:hypothetical protein
MLTKQLRQLPYLLHTNRELGLMLRGIKPLAYFADVAGREPDYLARYWRMFDRRCQRVSTGPEWLACPPVGPITLPISYSHCGMNASIQP